jgi:type I restriction enzyme S subunit
MALKRVANIIAGQSPPSEAVSSYEQLGLPFLQGNAEFGDRHPIPVKRCDSAPKTCESGDVLLSVRAPVGALNIADRPYGIGRGLCAVRPVDIEQRFLWWLLHAYVETLSSLAVGSTYDAVTRDVVGGIQVSIPTVDQQRAIADYLDAETARIDALVNLEERRLDIARERFASMIELLVLGRAGVRIRADESAGLLEPVPVSWSMRRNKTFMREIIELSTSGDEELLTVSHLTGVTPRSEKNVTMFLADSNEGYKKVRRGDLVINTMWAWMGALGVSPCDGIVSPAYGVYRFTDVSLEPMYFDALFRSAAYVTEMTRYSKGVWSSRLRLYPESFLSLTSPMPPAVEQRRIVNDIRDAKQDMMALQELLSRSISLLVERRQALITAAATGQLDIPEVVHGNH